MTQTPETPNQRLDRLETALGRFAEISFQSYRQHDEALTRLETITERLVTEGAEQRQQAAIDRQEFRQDIRQIWEYLRDSDRNGGSSPPA